MLNQKLNHCHVTSTYRQTEWCATRQERVRGVGFRVYISPGIDEGFSDMDSGLMIIMV